MPSSIRYLVTLTLGNNIKIKHLANKVIIEGSYIRLEDTKSNLITEYPNMVQVAIEELRATYLRMILDKVKDTLHDLDTTNTLRVEIEIGNSSVRYRAIGSNRDIVVSYIDLIDQYEVDTLDTYVKVIYTSVKELD